MTVKKYSGNYEVLDSGLILTASYTSNVEFQVEMSEEFTFSLVLNFANDEENKYHVKSKVEDSKILLTCINFDKTTGIGTTSPIRLARFEGKNIYINFWVRALGDKAAREVSYSLLMEK